MTLRNAAVATVAALSTAAALATFAVSALVLTPRMATAQSRPHADSRSELYRRKLLASRDVPCRTNASCAALGVEALSAGQTRQAQALVSMEAALAEATAMQAAEDNSPKETSSARARMAMALIHEGDVQEKLGALPNARAFYRTALSRGDDYPGDAALARVAAAARERLAAIANKDVVEGMPLAGAHFRHYAFFGAWNTVDVKPVKGRRGVYRIDGDFVYPTVGPDGESSANLGSLSAYVRFHDGVARVPLSDPSGADGSGSTPIDATAKIANLAQYDNHDDRCLLELKLSAPETLEITTHGSALRCGFGHNVTADGRYYLMTGSSPAS